MEERTFEEAFEEVKGYLSRINRCWEYDNAFLFGDTESMSFGGSHVGIWKDKSKEELFSETDLIAELSKRGMSLDDAIKVTELDWER